MKARETKPSLTFMRQNYHIPAHQLSLTTNNEIVYHEYLPLVDYSRYVNDINES